MRSRSVGSMKGLLIAGTLLVLCAASPSWAEVSVDFGGGAVKALKDGRVVLSLEVRSDVLLRAIRIETDPRFPLVLHGARFDKKLRWLAVPLGPRRLRLTPHPGGPLLKALDVSVSFRGKPGVDPPDVFRTGGRGMRPSFTVIGIRGDGREEGAQVFLPYVPNVGVSHE